MFGRTTSSYNQEWDFGQVFFEKVKFMKLFEMYVASSLKLFIYTRTPYINSCPWEKLKVSEKIAGILILKMSAQLWHPWWPNKVCTCMHHRPIYNCKSTQMFDRVFFANINKIIHIIFLLQVFQVNSFLLLNQLESTCFVCVYVVQGRKKSCANKFAAFFEGDMRVWVLS